MTCSVAIPGVLVLVGICVAVFFWLRSSVTKSIQQGDSFFEDGNLTAADDRYTAATKLSIILPGKETAELYLKLALLQHARNSDLECVKSYIDDALNAFSNTSYASMERLARRFNLKLSNQTYLVFREREIRQLHKLLTSPENLPETSVFVVIRELYKDVWAHTPSTYLDVSARNYIATTEVKIQVSDKPASARFDIEIVTMIHCGCRFNASDQYDRVKSKTLTSETILDLLANSSELKSQIIDEITTHMARVTRVIFDFAKERRIGREIDQIAITVLKTVPVAWLGRKKWALLGERFEVNTVLALVGYPAHTDFTTISKLQDLSNRTMGGFWDIEEDQIYFIPIHTGTDTDTGEIPSIASVDWDVAAAAIAARRKTGKNNDDQFLPDSGASHEDADADSGIVTT